MTNLEQELARALARKEAPPGFSRRVLERVDGSPAARAAAWRRGVWRGAVAAGLAMVISTGVWLRHEREERLERVQGEAAKQLALVALRIASEKTNVARNRVRSTGTYIDSKETSHEQPQTRN